MKQRTCTYKCTHGVLTLQEQIGYLNPLKTSQLQVSNEIVQSRNKTGRTKKFCSIPVVRSVHHS